jgi:hypothetical protein
MRPLHLFAAAALTLSLIGAADGALAQGGKRFARTDTNGDGKISLQEFLAARGRIFDRIDANHDGTITQDEIAAAAQSAEATQAGRMIRSGKEGGGEGGGQLARLQKMAARGPLTRQVWDQMMTRRFEKLDVQHLGYLTMDQMRPHRERENEAAPGATPPAPGGTDMAVPMAPAAPHP